MANRLSDDDLRKSLQDYGEDVGPITPTTRSVWEKKLLTLRKSNGPSSKRRSLNAFSSDDSEIENAASSRVRKRRSVSRNESSERLSLNRSRETNSSPDSDVFKKPSPLHIPLSGPRQKTQNDRSLLHKNQYGKVKTRKSSTGRSSTFDVETSDSDFDTESPSYIYGKSNRLRRKTPGSSPASDLLSGSLMRHSDGTNFESSLQRKSLGASWNTDSSKTLYHFTSIQNKSNREISNQGFRTNGYLTNTISNGDFREEKIQGSSTNYSHCVSWMLLIGAFLFFIIIGVLYMSEVKKSSQIANKNYSEFCNEAPEEVCKKMISISQELYLLLTTVAGQYECDSTGLVQTRNMTVAEARSRLFEQFSDIKKDDFNDLFHLSLRHIFNYPKMGIKWYSTSDDLTTSDIARFPTIIDSSALEATQAAKSLWCRIRLSLQWTTSRLLLLCAFIFVAFLSYIGFNMWKKYREAQEKLFYEMVEKVIDILQEPQDSSYQPDSHLGPYKAVVNIRDTIIMPKERKDKLWLWDKVVAFIEENESRVSVEFKKINGEDFKVWRWHPNSSDSDGNKQGKVWQGQAFNSSNKGKNATYSPTPCLKIRNMFDSEVEYGDNWQVNIQDAILEKCEGIDGIRHIAVDTSSTEGCVYMLCSSSEAAGRAFNALHGWWFDGKLVTVKYIRYERYLERFPAAKNCVEPLKPSNNMRLSLSTPFFSSALERS